MKKTPIDPVVLAAKKWFKQEVSAVDDNAADGAVLVYRMLAKFPMTAAQYWQVSSACMTLLPEAYTAPWLSVQAWKSLSDWDGTGRGLARLSAGAESFWAKDGPSPASREFLLRELKKRMSVITPDVAWDGNSFKTWIADSKNPLGQWSASAVKALSLDVHADLLTAYLFRGGDHDYFEVEAVRQLIDSRQWSAAQIQGSIDSYMRGSSNVLSAQAKLIIDAWMGTLEWTPETAEMHVSKLCKLLKNENLSGWECFLPRIGAGLACLANAPVDLFRVVNLADKEPGLRVGSHRLMAMFYAYVNAEMPEHFMVGAMRTGAIMHVLKNKSYPIAQRLAWLKEYADYRLVS